MPRLTPRLITPSLVAAALLGSACYKVTVVTAPEPANAAVVDKPWNNSFIYGLVPPGEIDVSQRCTAGVAKVVTQRSFLNSLVGGITWGIYTPLQVTTTCANAVRTAQQSAPQMGIPLERLGVVPAAPSASPDSAR